MSAVSALVTGVVVGVIAFVGLVLAAHAADERAYTVGLVVFVLAVAFEFWLLKRWFDYGDRDA
jgi:hypothetical protein